MEKYLYCPYCGKDNLVDLNSDFISSQCDNCGDFFGLVEDDDFIIRAVEIVPGGEVDD